MTDRQEQLLEELLAWTRFANRQSLIDELRTIADPKHLAALELTDGSRTQTDVAKASGLAQSTVSNLWLKWRRLGLVMERSGKVIHLARPTDMGFEVEKGNGLSKSSKPTADG